MAKQAQRQQLIKVDGIEGYFSAKQGGDQSSATSKVWDGGSLVAEIMSAPPEIANITVSRAYDWDRDGSMLANLRTKIGDWETKISVTYTDRNLVPVGNPTIYANALLTSIKEPDYAASSAEASTFSLEFAVPAVAG